MPFKHYQTYLNRISFYTIINTTLYYPTKNPWKLFLISFFSNTNVYNFLVTCNKDTVKMQLPQNRPPHLQFCQHIVVRFIYHKHYFTYSKFALFLPMVSISTNHAKAVVPILDIHSPYFKYQVLVVVKRCV